MNKICCKSCKSYIYSQVKLDKFQCLPCKLKKTPSVLKCTACRKSDGIMIRANGEDWIHYNCMMALKDLLHMEREQNIFKDLC
ncbi:unnamed protein product [Blepharisma stoltei]|uniref:Uncharacterized protein n=1 Tax=Blepharisma stoltei TaxID=1481888 RepID=A0AAU9KDT2_9CILI|nr:unnamed protein product [Blepharisma stoltei]